MVLRSCSPAPGAMKKFSAMMIRTSCPTALHKFFGSRHLRAPPQGYSPWTSLAQLRGAVRLTSADGRAAASERARSRQRRTSAGTEALGRAQARSRASSPGETPAGDDYQKTCQEQLGDDCLKNFLRAL